MDEEGALESCRDAQGESGVGGFYRSRFTQNGVHIYVLAIVDIPLCESSCECRLFHRSKRHHNSSKKQ